MTAVTVSPGRRAELLLDLRDFRIDGKPASGPHSPHFSTIREIEGLTGKRFNNTGPQLKSDWRDAVSHLPLSPIQAAE